MKYNIANPATGQQIKIEIDDDKINRHFSDRRMGSDVDGGVLREDLKGYTLRITGGNDRQGFAMKQGVLVNGRVRILLKSRTTLYRPRRTGERKRKSVRGCICGPDLAALFLRVLEKGPGEVAGLTDAERPRRLGPKRANRIRAAFALRKQDDPRKCVVRRAITKAADAENNKAERTFYKAPKVQRLITDKRLRRKALHKRAKKDGWKATRDAHVAYEKLLSKFLKEKKAAYKESHSKSVPEKASPSPSANQAKSAKPAAKTETKKEAAKPAKTAKAPETKPTKGGKGKK